MKKLLLKLIGYKKYKANVYTGIGYIQGIGFNVSTENIRVFGLEFITHISVNSDSQWMRKLKIRWEQDNEQQLKEKI